MIAHYFSKRKYINYIFLEFELQQIKFGTYPLIFNTVKIFLGVCFTFSVFYQDERYDFRFCFIRAT